MIIFGLAIFITALNYAIAEWYIHKHSKEPLMVGTTFVPAYAQSFGLDPKQTLAAILGDLGMKEVRLVSYWDEVEPTAGNYDFSQLDWQFDMANYYGAKVSLAIGMRQPRWPECHTPAWASSLPKSQWQPRLYQFMQMVVGRYKNNPALYEYQLENEFFMKVFGKCTDFDGSRLIQESKLVKAWDSKHELMISRSDNWVGIPVGQPRPDIFGISVYKRVWDATITHRYFEYPLPPWFYAALAGSEELYSGKSMVIHELQAEPWAPHGLEISQISKSEQFKSMNAARLKSRIKYGEDTGMRNIDLWGAEWWYWLKVKQNDSSLWDVAKQAVLESQIQKTPKE